jgi:hypothetical protein
MKLPEDSIGSKLDELGCGNYFLDMTPKTWSIKEILRVDFVKIQKLLLVKDHGKGMGR